VGVRLCHFPRRLCEAQLLCPVLVWRLAKPAVNAIRCAVLHVCLAKVGLRVRHVSAREVVLMVVLSAMGTARMVLMLLVVLSMVLMVLVVREGLVGQVHLHRVILVRVAPIHHDMLGLVTMLLVEHAELLRGLLASRRSRRRGGVGVAEGDAGGGRGRPDATGEVSYIVCVLRIECLAGSPLVDRVFGHLRERRRRRREESPGEAPGQEVQVGGGARMRCFRRCNMGAPTYLHRRLLLSNARVHHVSFAAAGGAVG